MTDTPFPADAASRQRRLAEGFDLLRQGRVADALRLADALRAVQPDDPEVQFLASEARLANEDAEGALECIEAAVRLRPDEVVLALKLAENLVMLRRRRDAKDVAMVAAEMAPADGATQYAVGRVFLGCGDPLGARAYYERALQVGHASPGMFYELAVVQQLTGDVDRADATVAALLAQVPQAGQVLHLRSTLRRATRERNHVAALEAQLAAGFASDLDRAGALFALGRELEELGESERAFAAIREGAALKCAQLRGYDAAAEIATIDAICATYDAAEMARAVPGHPGEGPVFVVGMPGSGTTLVERMLSRHSQVGSAGELLDFGRALAAAVRRAAPVPGQSPVAASRHVDFAALGRDYVRGAREAAPARRLFVDALPANYMYCGLIRRALPDARIVHVLRDPMDNGDAIFRTFFSQAYLYSCDLRAIADHLACHQRTMGHWHAVLGEGIVTVRHEDLVADPEGQARRLIAALGLEWEPAVLVDAGNEGAAIASSLVHEHSAAGWRDHATDLAPLRDRLEELGVLDA
jgi:tetratricopeptide (TPR) repeat protein